MTAIRGHGHGRLVAGVVAAALVVAACGDDDGDPTTIDDPGISAEDAAAQVEAARDDFCAATETYVAALDDYGQLFTQSAVTVGDITVGGGTLVAAESEVLDAAADYDAAVQRATAAAEREAADAAAEDALDSTTTEPPTTTTFPPLTSPEKIEAVRTADGNFEQQVADVDEGTPLLEASIEVTSSAYALEVAWAQLFMDAGCLDDPANARAQIGEYVTGLQNDLTAAGFYSGAIDGIYGPETAEAVRQLQAGAGLPVTGLPDPATQIALNEELADQEAASIAALQGILAGLGFYAGPIDGIWSEQLQEALVAFQTDQGQEPTGTVTIETLVALQQLLAGANAEETTTTTAAEETTTTTTAPADTTATTGG